MLSRHGVGTYQGNELTRNSSGNTRQQSSQFSEPLWTDPGVKSGISVSELVFTFKKSAHEHSQRIVAARKRPSSLGQDTALRAWFTARKIRPPNF